MIAWPQWTRKVSMEGEGRDPLGLSRASDLLTGSLLPGIITTTDRARYYSFYTWAIRDIERLREKSKSQVTFESEFQRREAAFAMASHFGAKTKLPIVGIRRVKVMLASANENGELTTDFPVLPSNPTGGFGQYYGGCLQELGLIGFEAGEWVARSPKGSLIADAFAKSSALAPYLADAWRDRSRVPEDVLRQSGEIFSLDSLSDAGADAERELLIGMFLDLDEKPSSTRPQYRQASLGLFLHVLSQYEHHGSTVSKKEVDRDAIFWPHYFQAVANDDKRLIPYEAPPGLDDCQAYWEHFCAHQFVVIALETFFEGVLNVLSLHPQGLTAEDLADALIADHFMKDLKRLTGAACSDPSALFCNLGLDKVPDAAASATAAQRFNAIADLNEWNLWCNDEDDPVRPFATSVVLMALLYAKWRGRIGETPYDLVQRSVKDELWLGTVLGWLQRWQEEKPSWREITIGLVNWLGLRHDTVKFQKRKLEASWLEVSNGRLFYQRDIAAHIRASRHSNATMILQDLSLIEHVKPESPLVLTPQGKAALGAVLELRK